MNVIKVLTLLWLHNIIPMMITIKGIQANEGYCSSTEADKYDVYNNYKFEDGPDGLSIFDGEPISNNNGDDEERLEKNTGDLVDTIAFEFWLKFPSIPTMEHKQEFSELNILTYDGNSRITKLVTGDNAVYDSVSIKVSYPDRRLSFRISSSDWNMELNKEVYSDKTVHANRWYHIYASYEKNQGCYNCARLSLYINGILQHDLIEIANGKQILLPVQENLSILSGWPNMNENPRSFQNRYTAITPIRVRTEGLNILQINKAMTSSFWDTASKTMPLYEKTFIEVRTRLFHKRDHFDKRFDHITKQITESKQNYVPETSIHHNHNKNVSILLWAQDYSSKALVNSNMLSPLVHTVQSIIEAEKWEDLGYVEIIIMLTENEATKDINQEALLKRELMKVAAATNYNGKIIIQNFHDDAENANVEANYASVMNWGISKIKESQEYLLFMKPGSYPLKRWLTNLLLSFGTDVGAVGSKTIYQNAKIFNAGLNFVDEEVLIDMEVTTTKRLRGYDANDERAHSIAEVDALTTFSVLMKQKTFKTMSFDAKFVPEFEMPDLSIQLQEKGLKTLVNGQSVIISSHTPNHKKFDLENDSDRFSPGEVDLDFLASTRAFSKKWGKFLLTKLAARKRTDAKLNWIIHCGGSTGLEAAQILPTLESKVTTRTIIDGFQQCNHADTISGLPAATRTSYDRSARRRFVGNYEGVNITSEGRYVESQNNKKERHSIVLYAKDYREVSMFVPWDGSYYIGRYMFETKSLPKEWVDSANILDEIWVPSQWQKESFIAAGVDESKLFIAPEAVDPYQFDPDVQEEIALPGTVLDGKQGVNKPYVFLSVFKFEDRKGWRKLVDAYVNEFNKSDNVLLLLRTYFYRKPNQNIDVDDKHAILDVIKDYIYETHPDFDDNDVPQIEIWAKHIPAYELPGLYKVADAFVLPTHGEGWGLPMHEAMAMGLPTIATNFSGNTEFMHPDVSYLVELDGFVTGLTDDPWFKQFQFANPSTKHLQELMRKVFSNPEEAKLVGAKARKHVVEFFSPESVANLYADRIAEIQSDLDAKDKFWDANHGKDVLKMLPGRWYEKEVADCGVTKKPFDLQFISEKSRKNPCRIAMVTTWAPRECGIATYAKNMARALEEYCGDDFEMEVIPTKHVDQDINEYDRNLVKTAINERELASYKAAADYINENDFGLVILQHEFGIYNSNVICFAARVQTRLFTIMHTVEQVMHEIFHINIRQLALISDRSIVMTEAMRMKISNFHGVPSESVAVIPHGAPSVPYERTHGTEKQPMYNGRKIILSTGLLHPNKGLEYTVSAMIQISKVEPDALYVIQGKPHPSGDNRVYYDSIRNMVEKAGLQNHVVFYERFVSDDELMKLLQGSYVYVNAYRDRGQAVSGTLTMGLSAGTPTVSTPYPYAQQHLLNDIGILVPYEDSNALADAIIPLLQDDILNEEYSKRAYEYAKSFAWENIAKSVIDLARAVTQE